MLWQNLFGSIGVVASGILILTFATSPDSGWFIVDPILSIGIGLLILRSSWGLFMRVFKVLIEGTPKHLDKYRICSDMEDIAGVTIIHDVHAWTITSGYDAMTAHVLIDRPNGVTRMPFLPGCARSPTATASAT